MDGKRVLRTIRRAWITLGITATVVFVGWSLVAYRASDEAAAAALPDAAVRVVHDDGVWSFIPGGARDSTVASLVFFPGSLVDPVAYAPLLRAVAAAGHAAFMVELPRRGAFGGADDPQVDVRLVRVLARSEVAAGWVVGGHSRGAVVASRVASENRSGMAGLMLIGTSHPRDVDLSALAIPVTKIAGTRDGLASPPEVEANRSLLPAATRWVWIEGGNHSQMGWYGFQPGDRRARIPADSQRAILVQAALDVMGAARKSTAAPGK